MSRRRQAQDGPRWTSAIGVVAPIAVLIAGLGATQIVADDEADVRDRELQTTAGLVANAVADQLSSLLEVEIGGAAATAAALSLDPELSRETFRTYATYLAEQLPTLLGVGYVRRVSAAGLPALEAAARADGAPDFRLQDLGPGPDHAIVVFNEPAAELQPSWGLDVTSLDETNVALRRATDSGRAAVTDRLVLAVDRALPAGEQPAGYVAYAPVFAAGVPTATVDERRAAVVGWSNLPFRAQDLLEVVDLPGDVHAVVRDGPQPVAIDGPPPDGGGATSLRAVTSPNTDFRWTVEVAVPRSAAASSVDRPQVARVAGTGLSLLLATLVALVSRGSRRWAFAARRTTRELRRRARELERSNEDLDALATVVAHDLSEPLTVIGGYADLLARRYPAGSVLDDTAVEHLGTVAGAATRMRAMLDALLRMSRIRGDRHRPGPVVLGDVIGRAVANLQVPLEQSGAEVVVGRLPIVWGDRDLLVDLVQNLLSNAVRHRDRDRPLRIAIDAEQEQDRWRISIADNGPGIPVEQRGRIFETFRRLDSRDEGLGIGLAVAQRVVEVHDGEIDVRDTPGGGATFTFTLPGLLPDPPDAPARSTAVGVR